MKSIIFDLFGTLAFMEVSQRPFSLAFKRMQRLGFSFEELKYLCMGQDFSSFEALLLQHNYTVTELAALKAAIEKEIYTAKLFPEVREVLGYLGSQTDLYLLSNLASPYTRVYERLGLDRWIKKAFFSCEIGVLKPDPAAFEMILEEIGKTAEEVVMVGDSYRADVLGAEGIGMQAVYLQRAKLEPAGIQELVDLLG